MIELCDVRPDHIRSEPQALFVFLLLPVITSLRGIELSQLPGYLADGARPRRVLRWGPKLVTWFVSGWAVSKLPF